MASTNKTTNYELSQFIETDRPAWLTDYNGDMRTIDSTMKAISDVASGASGSISELADRMSTAEGNITTNANDIDALEARADSLEAQAQSTAGTIANIQTEQTAQNLGIEAATELGYNLARPYDSASTYAVGAYVLFQNTLYKCITAVPVGEAFDPTKWLAIKATDEISSGGVAIEYIPLTDSDFVVSNLTAQGAIRSDWYSSNAPLNTPITISNIRKRAWNGKLIKIGNVRIIELNMAFDFDQVSVGAKSILFTCADFTLTSPVLDLPTSITTFNSSYNETQYTQYMIYYPDSTQFRAFKEDYNYTDVSSNKTGFTCSVKGIYYA